MPSPSSRRSRRHSRRLAAPPSASFFGRLNQDCIDIVVEYAADSLRAVATLRLASVGLSCGAANFVRFRGHEAGVNTYFGLGWMRAIDAVAKHLGQLPRRTTNLVLLLPLEAFDPPPTELNLLGMEVSTKALRHIGATVGPHVENLTLSDVTSAGFVAIVERCPRLRNLSVYCWVKGVVTPAALAVVGEHCPLLKSLSVHVDAVCGGGLDAIVRGCPRLETLRILCGCYSGRTLLLAEEFGAVVQRCSNLTTLSLGEAVIDTSCLQTLIPYLPPSLRTLCLRQVGAREIAAVKRARPTLTIIVNN